MLDLKSNFISLSILNRCSFTESLSVFDTVRFDSQRGNGWHKPRLHSVAFKVPFCYLNLYGSHFLYESN